MKRSYSDEDRGTALATLDANGGNLRKTARDTGVPLATLQDWKNGRAVPDGCTEIRTQKKGTIADALEGIVWKVLDLLPDKLAAANVHDLNGTLKISTETMRLLRDEPTAITENRERDLTPDVRARRIAAVLAGADPGGDGSAHPGAAGSGTGGALPADVPAVN